MNATPSAKKRVAKKPSTMDRRLLDICYMLEKAKDRHLQAEVVWSFGEARVNGMNVSNATAAALSEWDL